MFRKITLALVAVSALGVAALAPTTASAGGGKKHWGHHHHKHHWKKHWGFYGPAYVGIGYGCWVKRWVGTPYGPRLKKIYVCY